MMCNSKNAIKIVVNVVFMHIMMFFVKLRTTVGRRLPIEEGGLLVFPSLFELDCESIDRLHAVEIKSLKSLSRPMTSSVCIGSIYPALPFAVVLPTLLIIKQPSLDSLINGLAST